MNTLYKVIIEYGNEEGYYNIRTAFKSSDFNEADEFAKKKALVAENDGFYFENVYLLDESTGDCFEYVLNNDGNIYSQKVEDFL